MSPALICRNWRRIAMCGMLLVIAGCVKKTQVGTASIYTMEWWVTVLTVVGCIAIALVGFRLRQSDWRGWIALVVGIAGLFVAAPSFALDRTVVDDTHFESRRGLWFSPTYQNVAYDKLTSINLKEKVSMRKGRRRVSYDFECHMKDGSLVTVPLGDTMKEAAGEIIAHVSLKGIPVTGLDQVN